jgi:hypothetical protein
MRHCRSSRSQREAHLPLAPAATVIELADRGLAFGVTSASKMGCRSSRSDGFGSRAHTDTSAHRAANRENLKGEPVEHLLTRNSREWLTGGNSADVEISIKVSSHGVSSISTNNGAVVK